MAAIGINGKSAPERKWNQSKLPILYASFSMVIYALVRLGSPHLTSVRIVKVSFEWIGVYLILDGAISDFRSKWINI